MLAIFQLLKPYVRKSSLESVDVYSGGVVTQVVDEMDANPRTVPCPTMPRMIRSYSRTVHCSRILQRKVKVFPQQKSRPIAGDMSIYFFSTAEASIMNYTALEFRDDFSTEEVAESRSEWSFPHV